MTEIFALIFGSVFLLVMFMFWKAGMFSAGANRAQKVANDMTESFRDPVADAEAAIAEANKRVSDMKALRTKIREKIADYQQNNAIAQHDVEKYENLAKSAGAAGNAADVSLAITKKKAAEDKVESTDAKIKEQQALVDSLTAKIDALSIRVQAAKDKKIDLSDEMEYNKFREQNAKEFSAADDHVPGLDKLEQDVVKSRIRADVAEQEANTDDPTVALEHKYAVQEQPVSQEEINKYLQPASPSA